MECQCVVKQTNRQTYIHVKVSIHQDSPTIANKIPKGVYIFLSGYDNLSKVSYMDFTHNMHNFNIQKLMNYN
jgi:hypothetical protein